MRPGALGNPFPIALGDSRDMVCDAVDTLLQDGRSVTDVHQAMGLQAQPRPHQGMWGALRTLRKRFLEGDSFRLVCVCTPARCHGDSIIRLVVGNQLAGDRPTRDLRSVLGRARDGYTGRATVGRRRPGSTTDAVLAVITNGTADHEGVVLVNPFVMDRDHRAFTFWLEGDDDAATVASVHNARLGVAGTGLDRAKMDDNLQGLLQSARRGKDIVVWEADQHEGGCDRVVTTWLRSRIRQVPELQDRCVDWAVTEALGLRLSEREAVGAFRSWRMTARTSPGMQELQVDGGVPATLERWGDRS